jgi:DNA-binding transcriptional ArsR family regulator
MDKEFFVDLTIQVYNLTLLFPKKEPLRYQVRKLANEILADLLWLLRGSVKKPDIFLNDLETKIEILEGFLKVAKSQNWTSPKDIIEIQEEYNKIKEELKSFKKKEIEKLRKKHESNVLSGEVVEIKESEIVPLPVSREDNSLNYRQEKILEILKEKDMIQVHHVKEVFPQVSKRTLRRDFESLLRKGLVERVGERSNTFYKLSRTEDRTDVS